MENVSHNTSWDGYGEELGEEEQEHEIEQIIQYQQDRSQQEDRSQAIDIRIGMDMHEQDQPLSSEHNLTGDHVIVSALAQDPNDFNQFERELTLFEMQQ